MNWKSPSEIPNVMPQSCQLANNFVVLPYIKNIFVTIEHD